MGKRGRKRAKRAATNLRDGPFIELGLPEDAQVYEVAPGILGMDLELRTGQAGGGITEIRPGPRGGITVTVGRPLLTGATELIEAGKPSSAVTAAHTASEAYVRHVLDLWAAVRHRSAPGQIRSHAFYNGNEKLLAAYEELSGDRSVRHAPFWTSGRLSASARRRNRIVHGGYICSTDEARATIEVLNDLHTHLDKALQRVGVRTSSD